MEFAGLLLYFSCRGLVSTANWPGNLMETEWYNRAEAIQKRITQLRDSL